MVAGMRLLVLGGSSFVGRAVVEDGVRRGWSVATFNRGTRPAVDAAVEPLIGDRLVPADLAVLRDRDWDVVVDTWSGAPRAAADSAAVLRERAGIYAYVSSGSVYAPPPPIGGDESSPTVDASPDATEGDYPELKRGAELAIERAFGDRALFARAGTILGPHEDVGRLPWWLLRMHRGGEVLAPGPPELPIQYVDARDLAAWMLDAAAAGRAGAYNVVRRAGEETMGSLLDACRAVAGAPDASLTWVEPELVLAAGIEPWSELPVWLPPDHEYRGMHAADVERVHADGLRTRPLLETVSDTWAWLRSTGLRPPQRPDRDPPGVDPAKEAAALAAARAR
jgi:2'-hydroxyisoflavone reductase